MDPLGLWPLCQMARPPLLFEDPAFPRKNNGSYTPENPCKTKTEEPSYMLQLCDCWNERRCFTQVASQPLKSRKRAS